MGGHRARLQGLRTMTTIMPAPSDRPTRSCRLSSFHRSCHQRSIPSSGSPTAALLQCDDHQGRRGLRCVSNGSRHWACRLGRVTTGTTSEDFGWWHVEWFEDSTRRGVHSKFYPPHHSYPPKYARRGNVLTIMGWHHSNRDIWYRVGGQCRVTR
jgi:hypothetical protein